jgi:hypothetical protein
MPGITSDLLAERVRHLNDTFDQWREERLEDRQHVRMNLGFSICEGEEDLSKTLEVASLMAHPDEDEEL